MDPKDTPAPVEPIEAPEGAPEGADVDLDKLKELLQLPPEATELDIITALATLVQVQQAKYDAILSDSVDLENEVANHYLEKFSDAIPADSRDFWKEQLIVNRSKALDALNTILPAATPAVTPTPAATPEPEAAPEKPRLRSRALVNAKPLQVIVDQAPSDATPEATRIARAIHNRATELAATLSLPYPRAFAQAEHEFTTNQES